MASVSRLRAALASVTSSQGLPNGEQEFFEELMAHRQSLIELCVVGPRKPEEQRELDSGKITINGRTVAVNVDFAKQAVFISQQLDCSERYVASLLQDVMHANPNLNQVQLIEATIMEYHKRRRETADCLGTILQAAERAETADATTLYQRIDIFVRQQLLQPGGGLSLAMKVFQEIHSTGNALNKAQVARQNAKSDTVPPSQPNAGLGADVLNARCDSLKHERRALAIVLFLLARMGHLAASEIPKLVEWLNANPRHAMTFYVLPTVLTAFDMVDPNSAGGAARKLLLKDKTLMDGMKRLLDVKKEWSEPGLKASILLKWALFLTAARRADPALENTDGFKSDDLETHIWNAVQGDCFSYLARILDLQMELPQDDFKPVLLDACEELVRSLITQASSELRKIKQRQEDLLAGARADRSRMYRSTTPGLSRTEGDSKPAVSPRSDLAMLFSFIGLLYTTLTPEKGLHFWGAGTVVPGQRSSYREYVELSSGKLSAFLQWSIWSTQARDIDMTMALFDMLSGLATGQQCSELTYNHLARGAGDSPSGPVASTSTAAPVSWTSIFGLLESWALSAAPQRPNAPPNQSFAGAQQGFGATQHWQSQGPSHKSQQLQLSAQDVLLAQSFLRLLSIVVTYCIPARANLSQHSRYRVIPTMVSLIPLGLPLELKGAVFDTLAAFCAPGGSHVGVEICRSVWLLMERLEVINVRLAHGPGAGLPVGRGVEVELEEVESVYKQYPCTIPFLNLLATLIHTPKRIPLRERVADPPSTNTIPESMGAPYRTPGIGPFVDFVVDNVFARIPAREYLRLSDRWRMNDLCLCFIERCLASFDLESLVTGIEELQPTKEAVVQLAIHPGFETMRRMLISSPLQVAIISYLAEGLDGFDKGLAQEEPYYRTTIIRVLRIVHRVLEIQDIFLDIFLPLLSELNEPTLVGDIPPVSFFIKLDQALSFTPDYIPALAAYITYSNYPELQLLSVKILTMLASSATPSQLAVFIDRSSESLRILEGYLRILDNNVSEDVEVAEENAEETTGAGAADPEGVSDVLVQAIRLAVLDLLIQNTNPSRSFPNIAHFLLFGNASSTSQIEDPNALQGRRACVHSILDLLNFGVRRLGERDQENVLGPPLFLTLPAFAERCYHIIYNLCQHKLTSESTMRYLRTRERFFARHLAAIPFKVPSSEQQPFIEVVYNDGTRLATTIATMASFLKLRSWILDLVALDLHVSTSRTAHKNVNDLLELMFGTEEDSMDAGAEWEVDVFRPFREVGQSHLRMIELVQSLDFDWSDSLIVQPQELTLLGTLNLQTCLRVDESGCEVIDRTALLSLLTLAKRTLHQQGHVTFQAHVEALEAEGNYILESCAIENHRRKVRHAVATSYESWRRLLDMALTKCFDRLPFDRRENMLFDLLHVLPNLLRSQNVVESTAILLAETILTTITKLREDRRQQVLMQAAAGDVDAGALPAERLSILLRSMLDCITDHNRIELVRGNLYAAVVNYIHLIIHAEAADKPEESNGFHDLGSSVMSPTELAFSDSSMQASSMQLGRPSGRASLTATSLGILKPATERLVAIVARDAIDGTEVWKTVAFMLLDSLVRLSKWEKHPTSLTSLARHGFLGGFVRGLKEADLQLQNVLKPEPDDLNSLYIYESKMSLLVRMAQTRQGAERLLEARVLPILADCEYLDTRPETDQAFLDRDGFLPSAVQRYHQLFLPALQLAAGMLVTLGERHTTAANQALQFLSMHRDTAVLLLKNDADELSLSVIEELRLLVLLCSNVVHLVPRAELLSSSGFGTLHGAIMALAATCMTDSYWSERVKPQTDAEIVDAQTQSHEGGPESKFRAALSVKEIKLKHTLISYACTASGCSETDFTLILSPSFTTPKQEQRPVRFVATVPTVGDAVDFIGDMCSDLSGVLLRIADLSAELASPDAIRVDNIHDVVHVSDASLLDNLDMRQRQNIVARELVQWRTRAKRRAQTILDSIEMLTLLVWRHLGFYLDGKHVDNPDLKGALAHTLRLASAPPPDVLRADAERKLAPMLEALTALDLNEYTLGPEWRSYESYRTLIVQRLADLAGLEPMEEERMPQKSTMMLDY
ncbi:nucleoporin Nup186/Nup192/Nup205 [Epithele typhae]|uniref:nucleoporin Nup186/Nup192/Nup205 n=1 Tax=Epithele typhae TaxID=378194 RepID=UPI002008744E|nr:nucleoporin Nup186/Nup192/Nup205 [Epithele typhae]KAH9922299.1 nucleoporin Nup186/Nup192/Nup205 [Epithele typhae]